MSHGGGFCERHGPFDPPHLVCPYCAMQDEQRKVFGPPPGTIPGAQHPLGDNPAGDDFVRQTVEPGLTEMVPRPSLDASDAVEFSENEPLVPVLGWLIVKEPLTRRGTIYPVEPNQVIGREGDLRWDDPRLSRQHARLTLERPHDDPSGGPLFHLWPFGPTNPVYINGREIRAATPLHENDEIRLGDTLFVFKMLTD